jgi:hypothetical protein
MCHSTRPEPLRTLDLHGGIVIPLIDSGDRKTVGIMTPVGSHDLDAAVLSMTPEQARHIASELIAYANR